jgi:hypothetical protein
VERHRLGRRPPAAIAPVFPPASGAGGPSLLVKDGTVYLYFNTRLDGTTYQTRLATAPAGTTWPAALSPQPAPAIEHPETYPGYDCVGNHWPADTDIKYDDTTDRFLAITTDQAYPKTILQAYESTDNGSTFTKTIITRGDYHQGARNPAILADGTGHIPVGQPTAIAYAHSTTCGHADLHWSNTTNSLLKQGSIIQPLQTSAADWHPDSGSWLVSTSGDYWQADNSVGLVSESHLTGGAPAGSSSIQVTLRGDATRRNSWIGVHFGKAHPDDTTDESGYTAYLSPAVPDNGWIGQLCLHKAGFGVLSCRAEPSLDITDWKELRIIQADGAIKVFLDGDSAGGLAVTDADDPFLGGYVGLATSNGAGHFMNFTASDNVPPWSTSSDWSVDAGSWTTGGTSSNAHNDGQINMVTQTSEGTTFPLQLGNGTYAATIRLSAGATPLAWAGLALTNHNLTGSWSSGGYLVFLRANGNLGVYKAGSGQVVADVATGTTPRTNDVRLRVLKTGANLQVYVNNLPDPVVNWTDPGPSAPAIGGFGLANLLAPATFTDVTYDGNQSR